MAEAFIGLGTNIGEREKNLEIAINCLGKTDEIEIAGKSGVCETDPVDYLRQPRFLNQVVRVKTSLVPHRLLEKLQYIEDCMGRKRDIPQGPRIIDLDILLFDNLIINSRELTVPHPEILNRVFVLDHLLELDPDLVNPLTNVRYREEYKGTL